MTETAVLGQMANAPLAVVLAQVRFSPYLTIEANIPAIQDLVRRDYPVFRKGQIQTIEIGSGGAAPNISTSARWEFADADNREGFIVLQNSLVFVATRYKTFGDFASRKAKVLQSFQRAVPDMFVERLGLRYVDLIVPQEGQQPEEYLVDGLRGFRFPVNSDVKAFQSRYIARWRVEDGIVVFRFLSGAAAPFLPPDLQLDLEPAEIVKRATEAKTSIGLMDFDRMLDFRAPYNVAEMSRLFSRMHDDASAAFKRAMSPLAEAIWNSRTGS